MSQLDDVRQLAESEHDHAQHASVHDHHEFRNYIYYTSNIGSLVAAAAATVYAIIVRARVKVFSNNTIEPDLSNRVEAMSDLSTVIPIPNGQGTEDPNNNNVVSAEQRFPSRRLLEDNVEARQEYLSKGVQLYKAALRGDWKTAKAIIHEDQSLLTASISTGGLTVLHLAVGTDNVHFVNQLVGRMRAGELELRDDNGNTALCFAAATGTVQVAEILLRKNRGLATMQGTKPLYLAALSGKSEMAQYLYPMTNIRSSNDEERIKFFSSCINTGIYDLALKMAQDYGGLATASNMETALHLLAKTPEAFADGSSEGCCKLFNIGLRSYKKTQALELVKYLWEQVFLNGHMEQISTTEILLDATKMGNFKFLSVLLNSNPDLVWKHDSENRTIIHYAVEYRHANIYNIIHDIGPIKDVIATYVDTEENNLLHLAAKLPPSDRLNIACGPALQMQQELLWFQEVRRIMQPQYVKQENNEHLAPEQSFRRKHQKLLEDGEKWMKSTASSCMVVSALITTVVFAAAFTLPGGIDNHTRVPNYLGSTWFMIFVLSDGLAFISSVVSITMFLSILTSRYAESDFLKSLPLKLMIGLASLFFSLITMVVAFCSTFVLACPYGLKWIPFLISIAAFVPIACFLLFQFPLWYDTLSSTYRSRTAFQPIRRMLY